MTIWPLPICLNVMFWTKLSFVAREAMAALINDSYPGCIVVSPDEYPKRYWPKLPPMKSAPTGNPNKPMWCPVRWFANPAAFSEDGGL